MAQAEREHPRYAHEAAITVHVQGKSHHGRTTNVSRGGFCADLSSAIAMGSDVEVDLQLVFDDDAQSDALRLPGRVVWCTTVDDGFQVGVSFKALTEERSKYLTLFLRYLDDSGPAATKPPKLERSVDDQFG